MADAQEMVDRMKQPAPKYTKLTYDVLTINEQIHELVSNNEGIEGDIDVWEAAIKQAKRTIAKNEKMLDKLRQKRDIVAEAAFKASRLDQP